MGNTAMQLQQLEETIQTYHVMFGICCFGAIVFGILAVIIYKVFHINLIFAQLSGRYRYKEIQKIHKSNMQAERKIHASREQNLFHYEENEQKEEWTVKLEEETVPLEDAQDFVIQQEVLLSQEDTWIP